MPLTKEKKKLNKLIQLSDSDDSEHELGHYMNDRVKLMKEVLKTIKPKKIKAMAPACLKDMDMEEINSMLLEELLGISNKRLKYIFNGQNIDEDSSSSTNEDEPIDVISLDDISDDEFIINVDDDSGKNVSHSKKRHKHTKVKKEKCAVKKEKRNQLNQDEKQNPEQSDDGGIDSNKNLMSVLELLELQARARAIKSQLLLENANTQRSISAAKEMAKEEQKGSDDDVIIESTKTEEIIITSSESEGEVDSEKKRKKHEEPQRSTSEVNQNAVNQNENGESSTLKERSGTSKEPVNKEHNKDIPIQIPEVSQDSESGLNIKKPDHNSGTIHERSHSNESVKDNTVQVKVVENEEIRKAELNPRSSNSSNAIVEDDEIYKNNSKKQKTSDDKEIIVKSNTEKKITEKHLDNDEIIVINLSDDEMNELK